MNLVKVTMTILVSCLILLPAKGGGKSFSSDQDFALKFIKLPFGPAYEGVVQIKYTTGELGLLGGSEVVFDRMTSLTLCRQFGYRTGDSRTMKGSLFNINPKYIRQFPNYKCSRENSAPFIEECVIGTVKNIFVDTIEKQTLLLCSDPIFTLHFKKLPNTKDSEGIVEIEFSTGELGLLGGKGVVFNFKTSSALCHHFGYRSGTSSTLEGSFFNLNPTYTQRLPTFWCPKSRSDKKCAMGNAKLQKLHLFRCPRSRSDKKCVMGNAESISDDIIERQTLLQCFGKRLDHASSNAHFVDAVATGSTVAISMIIIRLITA